MSKQLVFQSLPTTTNALFANEWCPCEQNNHIKNVYAMITIICVWFKIYIRQTQTNDMN